MDEFEESPPSSKPSKIPSWVMLGFVFGAVFAWALPRSREPEVPVRPAVAPAVSAPSALTRPRLSDVEASFIAWQQNAVWADDVTYVIMWDSETLSFRDCYQVLRRGGELFFRSASRPRNLRVLNIPEQEKSPLQFLNPVPEERGLFGTPIFPIERPEVPK